MGSIPEFLRNLLVDLFWALSSGPQFGRIDIILQKGFRSFSVVADGPKNVVSERLIGKLPIRSNDNTADAVCSFTAQHISFVGVQHICRCVVSQM